MSNKELTRLWVANLTDDLSKDQIIHLFEKYGSVHNIVRKGNFASVEFENPSEALRAKRGLDQVDYHGRRLNIDWYRGDAFRRLADTNWWGGKSGHPRYKNRVIILGLPSNITYQQILNLAWEAGHSVVFIDISTSRVCGFIYGIIEYAIYEDYKYCVDYLDGKKMEFNGTETTLRFVKSDKLSQIERFVSKNRPKAEMKTNYPPTMPPQQPMPHTMPPTQPPMHPYPHPMQPTAMPPYYGHNAPPPPNYRPPPQNYMPPQ